MKNGPSFKTKKRRFLLSCSALAVAAQIASAAAQAQSSEASADEADLEIEEVIVTGSRIARPDAASNSPVQVLSSEEFEIQAVVEIDELLNTVPALSVPGGATTNSEGGGRASISLRNLGLSRTLVLMNGRRIVGSGTNGSVDINSISPALIQRVEVVTGGASAVYGSDAIAGVVNFITKDDFEGVAFNSQYGVTERGDGARYGGDVTIGMNSSDGRGNVIINGSYFKREQILAGERSFSRFALDESDSTSQCARNESGPGAELGLSTTPPCFRIGGSSRIPGTLLRLRGGEQTVDLNGTAVSSDRFTFDEGGGIRAFEDSDLFNFNPFVNLLLPLERYTISTVGHYDITDNIRFFAEGAYTHSTLQVRQAPFAVDGEDIPGGSDLDVQVSINSPFVTDATRAFLSAYDDGDIDPGPDGVVGTADDTSSGTRDLVAGDNIVVARQLRRRPLEAGARENFNIRDTFRIVAGFKGEIGDNSNWELFYNYGKHQRNVRSQGRFSELRFRQGVLLNEAGDACADPSGGCVPVNFFGPNTMTQEQLDFLTYEARTRTDIIQQQIGGFFNGEFSGFEAGPIRYSIGFEYRSEEADFNPDFASRELEADEPIQGSFDVKELFGEVNIPLLSGMAGAEYLGLEAGLRISDYDNAAGTVTTYKVGGEWRPIEDFKIRGLYQRAARAPNINELFSPINDSAEEARDICDGTAGAQRTTDAALDAFCDAQGVPEDYSQDQNQINVRTGGNPDLESEISNTYTVGFVWTPQAVPGLQVTADYYDISIKGGISQFGGGLTGTFAGCAADPRDGNPFCDALVRTPDGDIDAFDTVLGNANASVISTSGVDLSVQYRFDIDSLPGSFFLSSNGTYVIDDIFAASTIAGENDCAGLVSTRGLCGEGVPHFQAITDLTHTWEGLTTRLRYRYVGEIGSELVAFDAANGIERSDAFTTVGAEHYFDLFLGYQINANLKLNFAVNNLFDNKPPLIGDAGGEPNIDSQLHDPLGRRYTLALRASF